MYQNTRGEKLTAKIDGPKKKAVGRLRTSPAFVGTGQNKIITNSWEEKDGIQKDANRKRDPKASPDYGPTNVLKKEEE